jgi:hypothetical protein
MLLEAAASPGIADVPWQFWLAVVSIVGTMGSVIAFLAKTAWAARGETATVLQTSSKTMLDRTDAGFPAVDKLADKVGALAESVNASTTTDKEVLARLTKLEAVAERQNENLGKLTERVSDQYRRMSSGQVHAVKPPPGGE